MKIAIDPLPHLKQEAEVQINRYFNSLAYEAGQTGAEHAAKRHAAAELKKGGETPSWFLEAAEIEGLNVVELADLILNKPDEAVERGNKRRTALVAVRKAETATEVEAILVEFNPPNPATGSR